MCVAEDRVYILKSQLQIENPENHEYVYEAYELAESIDSERHLKSYYETMKNNTLINPLVVEYLSDYVN